MKKKSKALNDIILIAAVLSIAAIALCAYLLLRDPGEEVVVTVDGKEYARYSLSDNVETDIISKNGTNRLIIKDGKARIVDASCPDRICVQHWAISYEGDPIACKPNTVVVSIE